MRGGEARYDAFILVEASMKLLIMFFSSGFSDIFAWMVFVRYEW